MAPRILYIIMVLTPLTCSVRPSDPLDKTITSAASKAKKDQLPQQVAVAPGSAFVSLSAIKNAASKKDSNASTLAASSNNAHHLRPVDDDNQQAEAGAEAEYAPNDDDAAAKNGASADGKNNTVEGTARNAEGTKNPAAETAPKDNAAAHGTGVDIAQEWMDGLFKLIDTSGDGKINKDEWKEAISGPWADAMFDPIAGKDGEIEPSEFSGNAGSNWDKGVDAAWQQLGGDDGKITMEEIQGWSDKGAQAFEIDFAQREDVIGKDKEMQRDEFEEFLFTAMYYGAIDKDHSGSVDWSEMKPEADTKGLQLARQMLGCKDNEDKFQEMFGEDGLQLDELYKEFKKKNVFTPAAEGKSDEGAKTSTESGSVQAFLTHVVILVSVAAYSFE